MFAEHLAVVAGEDDEGVVVEPERTQLVEHLPDAAIGERDLTGIRIVAPLRGERLGGLVGIVRVVEVNEQEERLALVGIEPFAGDAGGLAALAFAQVADLVDSLEAVVVAVEALARAETAVEDEAADDGAGASGPSQPGCAPAWRCLPASRFSKLSRRPCAGGKVPVSIEACAGSVIGTGVCTFSNSTPWCASASMFGVAARSNAVGAEVVGAQRVDADEHDVADAAARVAAGRDHPTGGKASDEKREAPGHARS